MRSAKHIRACHFIECKLWPKCSRTPCTRSSLVAKLVTASAARVGLAVSAQTNTSRTDNAVQAPPAPSATPVSTSTGKIGGHEATVTPNRNSYRLPASEADRPWELACNANGSVQWSTPQAFRQAHDRLRVAYPFHSAAANASAWLYGLWPGTMRLTLPDGTIRIVRNNGQMTGVTSQVYFDQERTVAVKQVWKYLSAPLVQREACVLRKLASTAWSPKVLCFDAASMVLVTAGTGVRPLGIADLLTVPHVMEKMERIITDMESHGVEHNDIVKFERVEKSPFLSTAFARQSQLRRDNIIAQNKPAETEFVVMSNLELSLVDFGSAKVNGSLSCNGRMSAGVPRVNGRKTGVPDRTSLRELSVLQRTLVSLTTNSSQFCAHAARKDAPASPGTGTSYYRDTFRGADFSAPDRHLTETALIGIQNLNDTTHSVNSTQAKFIGASRLQIRNWQESVNVSVLPGAAPSAELHLLIFWRPSTPASAAAYDLAVRRFHDSIVGETVHLAFGDPTLSATKLTEFYRANVPVGYTLKRDRRGREPFVVLFLRLLSSSWTTCRGGVSARGQALCPPTNSFKMQVRTSSKVEVHATDNSAEVQSNLRTLDIHVQEASVGARRVRVGRSMTTDCTRDPACPLDPACFPRSLPMVMTAATKFAAASDNRLWSSVVELLHALHDAGVAYCISRNWEHGLPALGAHPDVDLFVSDYELTLRVIGGKRNTAPGRILVTKLVGDRVVSIDPRYVGDSYIDPAWMSDALRRRRPDGPGGTFVLAPVDHFFFLLYHALIHKSNIAPDYKNLLQHMGQMLLAHQGTPEQEVTPAALLRKGSLSKAPRGDRLALLLWYMSTHNYSFTRPTDPSVLYNIVPGLEGESQRPCGVSEL